jgi:hypothetical protein
MSELVMNVVLNSEYQYFSQLRPQTDPSGLPVANMDATPGFGELVEETYVRGVLSEKLPPEPETLRVTVSPMWLEEPLVSRVEIELAARSGDQQATYAQQFASGPWVRQDQLKVIQLRQQGTLAENESAYRCLVAVKSNGGAQFSLPPLQAPAIAEQSLEESGVRALGDGELAPDRPVIVNRQLSDDAVRCCEEAGTSETGGAVLGKVVRLPEPLPQTETRVVTILSATVEDGRHIGSESSFAFSPEALARAAQIGQLRGLDETVLTVFHTHGWSPKCGNCNQNEACPLPQCNPSLQDYLLLQTLFPGKGTLLPIAGRALGAQGQRPVFRVHAWLGGEMRAIPWRAYDV